MTYGLEVFGDEADGARADGATDIAGEGEECEHEGAAVGEEFGCEAKGSGPHDADGESADGAPDEGEDGPGGEDGDGICGDAEEACGEEGGAEGDACGCEAEPETSEAHHDGEGAGSEEVAGGFVDVESFFGEVGGPLGHAEFGGAGADHEEDEEGEDAALEEVFEGHAASAVVFWGYDGDVAEEDGIEEWDEGPSGRNPAPVVDADEGEESGGERGYEHGTAAKGGV